MQTVQFSYFKFSQQFSSIRFSFHPELNHVHPYTPYISMNLLLLFEFAINYAIKIYEIQFLLNVLALKNKQKL